MCRANARIRSDFAVNASGELMHVRQPDERALARRAASKIE